MKNKILLTAVSSFYILHSAFGQGALTPPGAPAPTMKSLDQIEPRTPISSLPFTITQPGSYYLTTNLTGNPGGITISAGDVTLDLMGFALVGGTGDGVFVSGSRTNIAIRNGAVRGWSIGVNATNSFNSSVSDLQLSRNTINGGLRGGSGALVRNCVAFLNATGIQVGDGSSVVNCVARNNGDIGIRAGVG